MQITFTNKHIFFALEGIWQQLDYRFKYQINQLITANPDDDYIQTVEVDADTLIAIYRDVSAKCEGVAKVINQEMQDSLQPQLFAIANMEAVLAGTEQPNEAATALIGIGQVNDSNTANLAAKILNGKTQILS